jgi:hypothetical protein
MSVLSIFVIERLQQYEYDGISEIFDVAEDFLASEVQELKDAVATCFLENLQNVTSSHLDPASFVSLLGPRSKEYCIAWDKFTGVKQRTSNKRCHLAIAPETRDYGER